MANPPYDPDSTPAIEAAGEFEDLGSFAPDAITRRESLYASYTEAAQDPQFMEDMRSVSDAFETTVADGLQE